MDNCFRLLLWSIHYCRCLLVNVMPGVRGSGILWFGVVGFVGLCLCGLHSYQLSTTKLCYVIAIMYKLWK